MRTPRECQKKTGYESGGIENMGKTKEKAVFGAVKEKKRWKTDLGIYLECIFRETGMKKSEENMRL